MNIVGGDPTGKSVFIQDQTSRPVSVFFSRLVEVITLPVSVNRDQSTFNIVTSGGTPVVGQLVCLKQNIYFYQGRILSVTPVADDEYTITVDSPLDYAFTTEGGCSLRDSNMAVNGSVTPVVFFVSPSGLISNWDVNVIKLQMNCNTEPDASKFGDLAALTNGVLVRQVDGDWYNIFNAKTNGDLQLHAYDVEFDAKAGGGKYSVRMRKIFNGQAYSGVALRLKSEAPADALQIIIRDDLTGLASFRALIAGHVVVD